MFAPPCRQHRNSSGAFFALVRPDAAIKCLIGEENWNEWMDRFLQMGRLGLTKIIGVP
jgi:hypothetical protein